MIYYFNVRNNSIKKRCRNRLADQGIILTDDTTLLQAWISANVSEQHSLINLVGKEEEKEKKKRFSAEVVDS